MAEAVQRKFFQEVEKFKGLQKDIQKYALARQRLDGQLSETKNVKEEVDILEPETGVYKLIGPALVKQDLEEAKQNVNKRIDYINGELQRHDKIIDDLNKKMDDQREVVSKIKQQLDQFEVKATLKS
ncbi:prefoldin subunit 6-like [Artemia franciscana]|uniref:Probable prefoldin subunit 6 n=1 Tax=Artemia franciscana TaxID=6661 RepID=A0AA88HB14_ARTSF|nr:hypothetical protein QYM36_015777 [Artemia franciscana]CAG4635884.1 EOG090X0MQF [Artemia franciscana]